jgi:hypothetical protein
MSNGKCGPGSKKDECKPFEGKNRRKKFRQSTSIDWGFLKKKKRVKIPPPGSNVNPRSMGTGSSAQKGSVMDYDVNK